MFIETFLMLVARHVDRGGWRKVRARRLLTGPLEVLEAPARLVSVLSAATTVR
jgi:hypothetical protein